MYSVPQQLRDKGRRQYDIPAMQSQKVLSPEIKELLHMLKAFETGTPNEPKNN